MALYQKLHYKLRQSLHAYLCNLALTLGYYLYGGESLLMVKRHGLCQFSRDNPNFEWLFKILVSWIAGWLILCMR